MKKLCIYHKNCNDGFAAATVVWMSSRWGEDTEFLPMGYGEPTPNVSGKDVIIVDFSFPRSEILAMQCAANSLIVLDHHHTAETELQGIEGCYFDNNRSGATMAWDYLFPLIPVPKFLRYIEDRDIRTNKYPETDIVRAGISVYPRTFESWSMFIKDPSVLGDVLSIGEVIHNERMRIVGITEKQWSETQEYIYIDDIKFPLVNSNSFATEIADLVLSKYSTPVVAIYYADAKHYHIELRSDGSVDVGSIARKYGGGGHVGAAGIKLKRDIKSNLRVDLVSAKIIKKYGR